MRKRVYISGPMTLGCKSANLCQAMQAQQQLIAAGFAPLTPQLTALLPWGEDVSHEQWLAVDCAWVEVAEAVLRLPGESAGAVQECDLARELGIPVVYSIEELHDVFRQREAS